MVVCYRLQPAIAGVLGIGAGYKRTNSMVRTTYD